MVSVFRPSWPAGFPDVVILADVPAVKAHGEYQQAKAGNVQDAAPAAKRLAASFVTPAAIEIIRQLPIQNAFLVPVHALEGEGYNRIPGAFAELLGEKLALDLELGIIQANVVNHTGANGWERISRPPVFSGDVIGNRNYVLVDDFIGQGGTLANLRGHIVQGGGQVLAAITLTGKPYSAKLALGGETLKSLRDKHGKEIEDWWRSKFGYGFEGLTESEARYLIRAENADTIRARLSEAGFAADS